MRVVVLGGHDRLKARVEQIARKYNISLKFINQETQQNIDSASFNSTRCIRNLPKSLKIRTLTLSKLK
jgi:hypothetical protein